MKPCDHEDGYTDNGFRINPCPNPATGSCRHCGCFLCNDHSTKPFCYGAVPHDFKIGDLDDDW